MGDRLLYELEVLRGAVSFVQVFQGQMRVRQTFVEAAIDDMPEHDAANNELVSQTQRIQLVERTVRCSR